MSTKDILLGIGALGLLGTRFIGRRIYQDSKGWRRKGIGDNYDIISIHGAGYQKTDDVYGLTDRGLSRVEAALRLYQTSPGAGFILCGGDIYGEGISEAKIMRDWLIQQNIDPEKITVIEDTLETTGNVQETIANTGPEERVVIVTNHDNVPRTQRICRGYGRPEIDVYSAERVLGNPPEYWKNRGMYLWEICWYLLLTIDPRGRIPKFLARLKRGKGAIFGEDVPE